MRALILLLALTIAAPSTRAQDLPLLPRFLTVTPEFLNSALRKTQPAPVPRDKSMVLVTLRLSGSGRVIDTRATGGSEPAKKSALNAVQSWRFKPTLVNGAPVQMITAALFDFSATPVKIRAPEPMTADQLSPVLTASCALSLIKKEARALQVCKTEAAAVDRNRSRTPMESLSAHDELGLALFENSRDAASENSKDAAAIAEFTRAIDLAPQGLTSSDGEWAVLYWHRAAAEQRANDQARALQDFAVAAKSIAAAAQAIPEGQRLYLDLRKQLTAQYAESLKAAGRADEAQALYLK